MCERADRAIGLGIIHAGECDLPDLPFALCHCSLSNVAFNHEPCLFPGNHCRMYTCSGDCVETISLEYEFLKFVYEYGASD